MLYSYNFDFCLCDYTTHTCFFIMYKVIYKSNRGLRGHGGRVVTLSPPTSEAVVGFPAWPQVGKLVVACRWSAVYSTAP